MKGSLLIRQFSKVNKSQTQASEFKSFFKLRIQDRPIKLLSKAKEIYKTNKTIRKTLNISKYFFAFGFLYFIFPGTFIPGQYYAKLIYIISRQYATNLISTSTDFASRIKFYNWKFNYLKKNVTFHRFVLLNQFQGMLNVEILSQDLNEITKLIDEFAALEQNSNIIIFDALGYINESFLPTLLKYQMQFFENQQLQNAIFNFLDIISLRFESKPNDWLSIKHDDQEEFLFRESLLTQFVNLCLVQLRFTTNTDEHIQIYNIFEDILKKVGNYVDLADSFTTMEGIQQLFQDMNNEKSSLLRYKALKTTRILIQQDELVGVKLFKLKLLSNLLIHTLQDKETTQDMKEEISLLLEAFLNNKYRSTLLQQSQDFKEEKKRLTQLSQDEINNVRLSQDIKELLIKSLTVNQ